MFCRFDNAVIIIIIVVVVVVVFVVIVDLLFACAGSEAVTRSSVTEDIKRSATSEVSFSEIIKPKLVRV